MSDSTTDFSSALTRVEELARAAWDALPERAPDWPAARDQLAQLATAIESAKDAALSMPMLGSEGLRRIGVSCLRFWLAEAARYASREEELTGCVTAALWQVLAQVALWRQELLAGGPSRAEQIASGLGPDALDARS